MNHFEVVPLNVDINFADFRFERAADAADTKSSVFALLWTQNNRTSEFYIAFENAAQFKNYEIYLNNLMKICRIAENGKHLMKFREIESDFVLSVIFPLKKILWTNETKIEIRN